MNALLWWVFKNQLFFTISAFWSSTRKDKKKMLCNEHYQRCWIWKRKQKLKATYLCTPHNLYNLSTLVSAPPKIIEHIFHDEFMKSTSIWYFNMYLHIHFHFIFIFFEANSSFELNRLLNTRICAKQNSNVQGNNSVNVLNDFECTAWIKCAGTKIWRILYNSGK